jgi:arginine/ornithine N-succinyltransferase beta subunit
VTPWSSSIRSSFRYPEAEASLGEVRDDEPDELFVLAEEGVEDATVEVFDCGGT